MELSVRTATGEEFDVDHCVSTSMGFTMLLYIEFVGYSMTEIFSAFSVPEKTITIYGLVDGEVQQTYTGYTKLAEIFIVPENNDHIRIRLEQEQEINVLGE